MALHPDKQLAVQKLMKQKNQKKSTRTMATAGGPPVKSKSDGRGKKVNPINIIKPAGGRGDEGKYTGKPAGTQTYKKKHGETYAEAKSERYGPLAGKGGPNRYLKKHGETYAEAKSERYGPLAGKGDKPQGNKTPPTSKGPAPYKETTGTSHPDPANPPSRNIYDRRGNKTPSLGKDVATAKKKPGLKYSVKPKRRRTPQGKDQKKMAQEGSFLIRNLAYKLGASRAKAARVPLRKG